MKNTRILTGLLLVVFLVQVATASSPVLKQPNLMEILDSSSDGQSTDNVLVNLQVDAEGTGENLFKVLGELERRGYTTTVYVTGDFAENNGLAIQQIQEHGHDIAFHGWNTGENLITMNYSMQQEILIKAKNSVENYSGRIEGFRPQYYSQNEDTYTILDSLKISYDSGFISGMKYIPGYENYSKPYKVTNHSFYAVPVSSYNTSTRTIYLCDLSATIKYKINATEWSSILKNKFDESERKNEPMVVVLHPWITGNETTGYWQAFTEFLNYTDNKKIKVVTTNRLLKYYTEDDETTSIKKYDSLKIPEFEVIPNAGDTLNPIRDIIRSRIAFES